MSLHEYQLIHANVALMRASLDHPIMQSFVQQVERINGIARASKGFIAELECADSGAVYNGRYLLNISAWKSVESLSHFVHTGQHAKALDDRSKWFLDQDRPNYVLFWLPSGTAPTEQQVEERLLYLKSNGPTPHAFNFSKTFSAKEAQEYRTGNA